MMRHVHDSLVLCHRELLRYGRERAYWVGQIVFPLAFVAMIGFRLERVVSLPDGTSYTAHLASGLIALIVGSGAVGAGFSLIEDRETGFLRTLLIAPVSRASIVIGKLVARVVVSLLLVAVLLGLLAVFTSVGLVNPGAVLLSVIGITSMFVALGIALGSRLRRLESFRLISAMVSVPLYLFSGIFYPVDTFPAAMRWLVWINPLTYGVDLMRFGLLDANEIPVATSVTALGILACAAIGIAVFVFDRSARG